ncbi:hypothetical protein KAR91_60290 [Candidatus Pacearchaeota archaeon]|nr:hypothetical protein [Candidatus Pacearchaeota archaeon]
MATITQWEFAANKLSAYQLRNINTALHTLLSWDFFLGEYSGQGLDNIEIITAYIAKEKEAVLNKKLGLLRPVDYSKLDGGDING